MTENSRASISRRERAVSFLIKAAQSVLVLVMFFAAWYACMHISLRLPTVKQKIFYCVITEALFALAYLFLSKTYHAFLIGYSRIRMLAMEQFFSQFFSVFAVYAVICVIWHRMAAPLPFIILVAAYIPLDILWAYFGNMIFFRTFTPRKTVLLYRSENDRRRFHAMRGKPVERMYRVTGEILFDGDFEEIRDVLDGFDAVFVAGVNSRCRNGILKYSEETGKSVFFVPHVGDVIVQGAEHIRSFDVPVLFVDRKTPGIWYAAAKRLFDIFSSLAAIILLSPLLLVTAAAVRLCDGGPVFYRQTRLTKDGRRFSILKFRSMRPDAEGDGVARLSTGDDDDRITPVGRLIRKCRIDELPQLFNILKGDMSVVGPRPERPEIAEQYCSAMPDFSLRLQVKAGLTGYAQVYGKYNSDPYEKLEFDLMYINSMSILTDIQLIFKTVVILFMPESTEGVSEGHTTAMENGNGGEGEQNP